MIVRIVLLALGLMMGVFLAAAWFYGFTTPASAPAPAPVVAQAPPPPPAPPPPQVLVAAIAIQTGTLITPQDMRFAPRPDGVSSETEFERVIAATPADQANADRDLIAKVTGSVARQRFDIGAPIIRGAVAKPGDSGFLAAVLQPGERAISIGVTAVSGAAGLIYPGDRVDVILTQTFPARENDPGNKSVSETIASDIRVLAIDQQLQAPAIPKPEGRLAQTVTLEVDPRQAEGIAVATKLGELSLSIRSLQPANTPAGELDASPGPVWAHDVSSAAAARSGPGRPGGDVNGPPPAPPQIRVMRGDKAENMTVQ